MYMKFKKLVFLVLLTAMIGFEFSNVYGYSKLRRPEVVAALGAGLRIKELNHDKIKKEIDLYVQFSEDVRKWLNTVEQGQESENAKNIVKADLKKLEKEIYSKYLMDHFIKQFNSIKGDDKQAIEGMLQDIYNVIHYYQDVLETIKQ